MGLLALPLSASRVPLELEVRWGGEEKATAPIHAKIELIPSSGEPQGEVADSFELSVPGRATLDLPRGSLWRIRVTALDTWAREAVVAVEGEVVRLVVELLPTSPVYGSLRLPRDAPEAQSVRLRFQSSPGVEDFAPAKVDCPVDVEGLWRCSLPVGTYDLRVGVRGFAPTYLWGIEITAEGPRNVGAIELRPGASLSGGPSPESEPMVSVELRPAGREPSEATNSERLQSLRRSVRVDARGHFQFTGVSPGEYWLVARSQGYADSAIGPLSVFSPVETALEEPLVLRRPANLKVVVEPPVTPTGEPWRLHLRPLPGPDRDHSNVAQGETDVDGTWSSPEVPQGAYLLTVRSSTTEWLTEEVEVARGAPQRVVHVPLVPVLGELRWVGEPKEVSLWFVEGSRKRSRFSLREDRFEGFLPYEGTWQVLLFEAATGERHVLEPVEVAVSAASGVARVDIEVPGGTVGGQVLDPEGEGLAGVEVKLAIWQEGRTTSTTSTDGKGRFEFDLLGPGRYILSVEDERFAVATQEIQLQEGFETPPVILRLERVRPLDLRVTAQGLPVPGAHVAIWPVHPGAAISRIPYGVTDVQGMLSLEVPERAEGLVALVFPPGFAARIVPLDPSAPRAMLPVAREGGTLCVEWQGEGASTQETPYLIRSGALVSLTALRRWATERGIWSPATGVISLSALEPGHYTVCLPGSPDRRRRAQLGVSDAETGCRSVFVPPSGDVTVTLH